MDPSPELPLLLTEILNLSLLTPSVKLLQLTMFQLTQHLLPVPLQETNQDGVQDIQLFQLQLRDQLTGLNHPLTDPSPELPLLLTEILNLSLLTLLLKSLQLPTFHLTQFLLPVPLQETNQDGVQDTHHFQFQSKDQSTGPNHPPLDPLLDHLLLLTETHNHSLLTPSLKSLQLPTSQLTQNSPLVPLQEISQDGDLDIHQFQFQSKDQSTGLNHLLTDPSLDHLLLPMEILNHSLLTPSVKSPQLTTSHLTQHLPLVPLQVTNQDGDLDIQLFQLQSKDQLTLLNHPQTDPSPELTLLLMEILNPSSLTLSVKSLQPPTFHLTQDSPLVPLQVTNQDGDLDIQLSQNQLLDQLTGLNHLPLDQSLDHSLPLTEILNLSSLLELPQIMLNGQNHYQLELPMTHNQDLEHHTEVTMPLKLMLNLLVEFQSDSEE